MSKTVNVQCANPIWLRFQKKIVNFRAGDTGRIGRRSAINTEIIYENGDIVSDIVIGIADGSLVIEQHIKLYPYGMKQIIINKPEAEAIAKAFADGKIK